MRLYTLLALTMLAATPAAAETLTLFSNAEEDGYVKLGQPGSLGDMIVWNSALETKDGTVVGTNAGFCIRLDAPGNFMCDFIIDHEGHGQMTFSGVQVVEPGTSRVVITGGTGKYQGATGQVLSTPVENRARFRFDIDYRLD